MNGYHMKDVMKKWLSVIIKQPFNNLDRSVSWQNHTYNCFKVMLEKLQHMCRNQLFCINWISEKNKSCVATFLPFISWQHDIEWWKYDPKIYVNS